MNPYSNPNDPTTQNYPPYQDPMPSGQHYQQQPFSNQPPPPLQQPYPAGQLPLQPIPRRSWFGRQKRITKVGIIGCGSLVGIFLLCTICSAIASALPSSSNQSFADVTPRVTTNQQQPTATTRPIEAPTPTPESTPTPKPEPFKVEVTSANVKLVDGKYRYFFDVRNHDTRPFEGTATIELYNNKLKGYVSRETFETTEPMEPTLGDVVFFDIHTGTPSVHGEYGITRFKFTIKANGQEVNSGEGAIPDKQF